MDDTTFCPTCRKARLAALDCILDAALLRINDFLASGQRPAVVLVIGYMQVALDWYDATSQLADEEATLDGFRRYAKQLGYCWREQGRFLDVREWYG